MKTGESIKSKSAAIGRPTADKVRFYYVYILKCNDEKPYTGCTNDLRDRISRHNKGQVLSTKDHLPIKLISYFAFSNKYSAYNFEKYLKSGSGRAFSKRHFLKPKCSFALRASAHET